MTKIYQHSCKFSLQPLVKISRSVFKILPTIFFLSPKIIMMVYLFMSTSSFQNLNICNKENCICMALWGKKCLRMKWNLCNSWQITQRQGTLLVAVIWSLEIFKHQCFLNQSRSVRPTLVSAVLILNWGSFDLVKCFLVFYICCFWHLSYVLHCFLPTHFLFLWIWETATE